MKTMDRDDHLDAKLMAHPGLDLDRFEAVTKQCHQTPWRILLQPNQGDVP
jgi:hypothetical protein